MENATKALLIAAAVLVAILIIGLGLTVYNMASETMDSVNMSGQEITAFNDEFQQYNGTSKRGSEVNAMLKTVLNNNLKQVAEGQTANENTPKFVKVTDGNSCSVSLAVDATSITGKANTSKLYDIEVKASTTTGLVNEIVVKSK